MLASLMGMMDIPQRIETNPYAGRVRSGNTRTERQWRGQVKRRQEIAKANRKNRNARKTQRHK